MPAFLYSIAVFFLAVGPHYFLKQGFLTGAFGAQITLDCQWTWHPEIYLALALLLVGLVSLKTRKALWAGVLLGVTVLAHAVVLDPVTAYTGEENRILILAHRVALQAHQGIRPFLAGCGLSIALISATFLWRRPRSASGRLTLFLLARRNLGRRRFRSASLVAGLSTSASAERFEIRGCRRVSDAA